MVIPRMMARIWGPITTTALTLLIINSFLLTFYPYTYMGNDTFEDVTPYLSGERPKLFILGEDMMGIEAIVGTWKKTQPFLYYTDPDLFLNQLFEPRSDSYPPVEWLELISSYDVLYGRSVSYFFRDIIEELPHETFQVLIVTRCVSDWGEDIYDWLESGSLESEIPKRVALYGFQGHLPRPMYYRKRFHELYNLWFDILEQFPQHEVDVFAFGEASPKELRSLTQKFQVPFQSFDENVKWRTRDPYCLGKPLRELHIPRPLDPLPPDQRKELKAHCAGLSKTGTTTLNSEINGHTSLRSLHFTRVNELMDGLYNTEISDSEFLNKALPDDIDVISDTPWCYWTLELSQLYPDLVVILLEREVDRWAHSWFCHKLRAGLWRRKDSYASGWRRIDTMIYSGSENGLLDRKRFKEVNRNVKLVIPEDRLLVLDLTQNTTPWHQPAPFLFQHLHVQPDVSLDQPFKRANSGSTCPKRAPLTS